MSTITPVNLIGQINSTGDTRAAHRELYAAEVLTKYHNRNVTEGKHINKVLVGGKSYKFPVFGGAAGAKIHTPGSRTVPSQIKREALTVTMDERFYLEMFIDELDEIMSDVDARGIYVAEHAAKLAQLKDQTIFRLMLKAARSQGLIPGQMPGGSRLSNAGYRTNADALASGIFNAATELKTKNVDPTTVSAFLTPSQESLLIQSKAAINKDWGGEGSYAAGSIARIGGIPIVVTNNLPAEDLSTDLSIVAAGFDPEVVLAKYRGDYSQVAGIICSSVAVATVTAVDLETRFVQERAHFGESIITSYAYGGGVYRPEGAVELTVGAL